LCAPVPGAGNVCVAASGCRPIGETCRTTAECCGGQGDGTGVLYGEGNTTCNIIPGTNPPLGTCNNPNHCDPEGDVCGQGGMSNARNNCCGCPVSPKSACCLADTVGILRCFYSNSACKAMGDVCQFAAECCNGAKCLPDPVTGILHCGAMKQCVAANGVCTATSDCCTGLQCVIPPGSPSGLCKANAICQGGQAGQPCSTANMCCTGYACRPPNGVGTCAVGEMDCVCFSSIP
jgi:hypothetical protein